MTTIAGTNYWDHEGKLDRDLLTNVLSNGLSAPNSVVFCLGGGASRTADEITRAGLPNTQVIAMNCDESGLKNANADKKLLVGRTVTFGKDAGGFPEVGERCYEMSEEEIREAMYGSDVVYIVSSLGGGFATGTTPKLAQAAREEGRVVVSLLFTPFSFEDRNNGTIESAIEETQHYSNSTVVTSNDEMMFKPTMAIDNAFGMMDRMVVNTIRDTSQRMDMSLLLSALEEEIPQMMAQFADLHAPQVEETEEEEEEVVEEDLVAA